jgi:membrane protein
MKKNNNVISKTKDFFSTKIWHIEEGSVSGHIFFFVRQLRIILIAVQGFIRDKCSEKASALTYYSLLSIVPVLALAFGIAKGFGFDEHLEELLLEKFADKGDLMEQVFEFAESFLQKTQGGLVAGVGIVVLFYSVMKVLNNIELSFNEIWEVKSHRSPVRMLSDYFSLMLLTPIIFIISNGATAFISETITQMAVETVFLQHFGGAISFILNLLPLSLLWFMFALIYMIMPNTRVQFSAALAGGIVAGIIFQIVQFAYVKFQVGVASYNAIYGSFAALPLFLIWLQMSWLIVLLGAELSFAVQNIGKYEFEVNSHRISHRMRVTLSLYIMREISLRFQTASPPLNSKELAQQLSMPVRIVRAILAELREAGLICEVKTDDDKQAAFQPAFDISKLSLLGIKNALETKGCDDMPTLRKQELEIFEASLSEFDNICSSDKSNKLITEII